VAFERGKGKQEEMAVNALAVADVSPLVTVALFVALFILSWSFRWPALVAIAACSVLILVLVDYHWSWPAIAGAVFVAAILWGLAVRTIGKLVRQYRQRRALGPLTKFCERAATPRMIHRAACDTTVPFGQNSLARCVITMIGDTRWASFTDDAAHPKRSLILCMVVFMAALDFWKSARKPNEIYSALGSKNPIGSMNSDVVVIEGSFFFFDSIARAVINEELTEADKEELTEADKDVFFSAHVIMCHIIQATTRCSVDEIFWPRLGEYLDRKEKIDTFLQILLRSEGKRVVNEPDRPLDTRPPLSMHSAAMWTATTAYVASMLPAYCKVYSNVVRNYPMD
jgi:hypothetical protein